MRRRQLVERGALLPGETLQQRASEVEPGHVLTAAHTDNTWREPRIHRSGERRVAHVRPRRVEVVKERQSLTQPPGSITPRQRVDSAVTEARRENPRDFVRIGVVERGFVENDRAEPRSPNGDHAARPLIPFDEALVRELRAEMLVDLATGKWSSEEDATFGLPPVHRGDGNEL